MKFATIDDKASTLRKKAVSDYFRQWDYPCAATQISAESVYRAYLAAEKFESWVKVNIRQELRRGFYAEATNTKASKKGVSGTGDIESFFDKHRSGEKRTRDLIIEGFEIAPHGLRSSRNWGIEVETGGARGVDTPSGWKSKYDGSLYSAYDNSYDGDHDDECATVRYEGDDCDCDCDCGSGDTDCREFVSPILHSYHSKGLEALVAQIATQPQNDSSGIHVHVEARDLTPRQIGSLVHGYNMIEPLIEASYQRNTRSYCQPRHVNETIEIGRYAKRLKSIMDLPTGDRYVALNLQSIADHGTVEFRAMGPVYNYEYLIRWAHFCREMVNVAKAGAHGSDWNGIKSFADLNALFVRFGSESIVASMSSINDEDYAILKAQNYSMSETELALVSAEV